MPRKTPKYTQKNQRKNWDKADMEQAILAVRENKMGTLKAAKTFNVPRTTLQTLSKNAELSPSELVSIKIGRKPILGADLEKELVTYLLQMEERFFGFTLGDLQRMGYQLALRNGLNHPFKDGHAGRSWVDLFLERHKNELSLRKPCGTKRKSNRGRKAVGACVITSTPYKDELRTSLENKNLSSVNPSKNNCAKKNLFSNEADRKNIKKVKVEKLYKKKQLKEGKQQQYDESSDDSQILDEPTIVDDEMSDLDVPVGNDKPGDADAACIFCDRHFSDDVKGELWVMCVMCRMWAHDQCAGAEKDIYICDFCK